MPITNITTALSAAGLRFAEAVLPGHPDKLADQVADALVDLALRADDRAIVHVEVAVHGDRCHVNGRISTAGLALDRAVVEETVRAVYERAGFGVPFEGIGDGRDFQRPHPREVHVDLACVIDAADEGEQVMRELSDDQAIHVGYAIGTAETDWLPMEQHLVLTLRDALLQICIDDRSLGAGPDGKVLLALREVPGVRPGFARWVPVWVVSSVQHIQAASVVRLERVLRELYTRVLSAEATRMPDLLAPPPADFVVRINESGPFVDGGPLNDNGQTGRKLVMDFYGPHVGIGGGALSGKDPWRLDRAGALRARQVAVAMVETGFVSEARVTLAWGPHDVRPSGVVMEADGRVLSPDVLSRWLSRFDLSLEATHRELGLARIDWEHTARVGAFRGIGGVPEPHDADALLPPTTSRPS